MYTKRKYKPVIEGKTYFFTTGVFDNMKVHNDLSFPCNLLPCNGCYHGNQG